MQSTSLGALDQAPSPVHATGLCSILTAVYSLDQISCPVGIKRLVRIRLVLEKKMQQALERRQGENKLTSGAECQDLGALCEDDMEQQQQASLPSIGRFEARYRYSPLPEHCLDSCAVFLMLRRHVYMARCQEFIAALSDVATSVSCNISGKNQFRLKSCERWLQSVCMHPWGRDGICSGQYDI